MGGGKVKVTTIRTGTIQRQGRTERPLGRMIRTMMISIATIFLANTMDKDQAINKVLNMTLRGSLNIEAT